MNLICNYCGEKTVIFTRECPNCGAEKSLVAEKPLLALTESCHVQLEAEARTIMSSGFPAYDKLIGGGFKQGQTYFLSADAGLGKTSSCLQSCAFIVEQGKTAFYFTGEETVDSLLKKCERLGISDHKPVLFEGKSMSEIAAIVRECRPHVIVIDSIQTTTGEKTERPTYATQTSISLQLIHLARHYDCSILAIGQVNKDGRATGPNAVPHNFDVVIEMRRGVNEEIIISTPQKNRQGPLDNRAVFRMTERGLVEKSEVECGYLLRHTNSESRGIAAFVTDTRTGLTVDEITVNRTDGSEDPVLLLEGSSSRHAKIIISVISQYFPDFTAEYIVRANITEKLARTSDLAIVIALLSVFYRKPIPHNVAFVATFDAAGELLGLPNMSARIKRAKEQGYSRVFGPPTIAGQTAIWEEAKNIKEVWQQLGF